MLADEFMSELRKARDLFVWRLAGDGEIRGATRRVKPSVHFNPISAVCFAKTGKVFGSGEWAQAADLIGLSPIDSGDTAAASDKRLSTSYNTGTTAGDYKLRLREHLLGALRLDDEPLGILARLFRDSLAWASAVRQRQGQS